MYDTLAINRFCDVNGISDLEKEARYAAALKAAYDQGKRDARKNVESKHETDRPTSRDD